jgi:hypothetical protein
LEAIASGILSPRKASQSVGVPPSTYWDWIAASQRGDERFLVEYCGEVMPFHKAVALARKIALTDALGQFETRLLDGDETPVFYQGRPQWVEDERLSTLDDATLAALGYPDRYLRIDGKRVQHVLKTPPPVAAVVKMLEANFKSYRPRSEVSIDQKFSGGVHVVNVNKPVPALPVVEIVPPALPPPPVEPPPGQLLTPEPEEPTAAHAAVAPRQISALERDLLDRLRAAGWADQSEADRDRSKIRPRARRQQRQPHRQRCPCRERN